MSGYFNWYSDYLHIAGFGSCCGVLSGDTTDFFPLDQTRTCWKHVICGHWPLTITSLSLQLYCSLYQLMLMLLIIRTVSISNTFCFTQSLRFRRDAAQWIKTLPIFEVPKDFMTGDIFRIFYGLAIFGLGLPLLISPSSEMELFYLRYS